MPVSLTAYNQIKRLGQRGRSTRSGYVCGSEYSINARI
jgi:hypothetical protein